MMAEKSSLYAVVGRGEDQTWLYALLDGVGVIEVRHLKVATALS
jgi:hypothetical protein